MITLVCRHCSQHTKELVFRIREQYQQNGGIDVLYVKDLIPIYCAVLFLEYCYGHNSSTVRRSLGLSIYLDSKKTRWVGSSSGLLESPEPDSKLAWWIWPTIWCVISNWSEWKIGEVRLLQSEQDRKLPESACCRQIKRKSSSNQKNTKRNRKYL